MSKLTEQLRAMKVFNNWEMIRRFGGKLDVCVDYHKNPGGLMGVGEPNRSTVWTPYTHPKLERPRRFVVNPRQTEKVFYGKRANSLPEALAFAQEITKKKFVPSPFGGYLPEDLVKKAKAAVSP